MESTITTQQNKAIVPAVIIGVIVAVAAFFGGMKYAESKNVAVSGSGNPAFSAPRQGGGVGAGGARRFGAGGANVVAGDIISRDDTSITVQLRTGGSKIVFISSSTPIMKTANGSRNDLQVGQSVMVTGPANQDGSVNAQSVQLRPAFVSSTRQQ